MPKDESCPPYFGFDYPPGTGGLLLQPPGRLATQGEGQIPRPFK